MKRTTRKVLAGALLVGLCQPLTALAADADLLKKRFFRKLVEA